MTTPADELRTAAARLRPPSPAVAAHTAYVRVHPDVVTALAELLDTAATYVDGHSGVAYPSHVQRAYDVARKINRPVS